MNAKHIYEEAAIEVLPLTGADVITSSAPFDGEDDNINEWDS